MSTLPIIELLISNLSTDKSRRCILAKKINFKKDKSKESILLLHKGQAILQIVSEILRKINVQESLTFDLW